jgi:hypothetical protein
MRNPQPATCLKWVVLQLPKKNKKKMKKNEKKIKIQVPFYKKK